MDSNQIKEQVARLDGFADGIKQGAQLLYKWLIEEMNRENKAKKEGE
jgi:hypothetical protein